MDPTSRPTLVASSVTLTLRLRARPDFRCGELLDVTDPQRKLVALSPRFVRAVIEVHDTAPALSRAAELPTFRPFRLHRDVVVASWTAEDPVHGEVVLIRVRSTRRTTEPRGITCAWKAAS